MIPVPSLPPSSLPVAVALVPFYSQFEDITLKKWQKNACGIVSLSMLIDFYTPDGVSPDKLLAEGLRAGYYNTTTGWSHAGLIQLAKKHGLTGVAHDLSGSSTSSALASLKSALSTGPVMASVHYKFDPKSTIPHIVVIDGISGDTVYYNDPAAKLGEKQISTKAFLAGWKKRFITIRPPLS